MSCVALAVVGSAALLVDVDGVQEEDIPGAGLGGGGVAAAELGAEEQAGGGGGGFGWRPLAVNRAYEAPGANAYFANIYPMVPIHGI